MLQQSGPWVMNENGARQVASRMWHDHSAVYVPIGDHVAEQKSNDVVEQIAQALLKAYGDPAPVVEEPVPRQDLWVTFTLHEKEVCGSHSFVVRRDHVIGVQAHIDTGCMLHLPSGTIRVKESVYEALERVKVPQQTPAPG